MNITLVTVQDRISNLEGRYYSYLTAGERVTNLLFPCATCSAAYQHFLGYLYIDTCLDKGGFYLDINRYVEIDTFVKTYSANVICSR